MIRLSWWDCPVAVSSGWSPTSGCVERFWLPVVGPTATVLLRRCAVRLYAGVDPVPEFVEVDEPLLAYELGLGKRTGRSSPLRRAMGRLDRFGLACLHGDDFAIARKVPFLTSAMRARLPESLRAELPIWDLSRVKS